METLGDVFTDSAIMTKQITEDAELCAILEKYFNDDISLSTYAYNMMELALKRGRKIGVLKAQAEIVKSHMGVNDVKYFDKDTNTFNHQTLTDASIEAAMEIPALEAVFANARPHEYFQQILSMAIHQHYVLEKIEKALHS